MIPLVLTAAALQFPAALFQRPQPAEQIDLASMVTSEDYPLQALWEREEGRTSVVVRIDERGRVSDCQIAESSGSAILDARTCELFRQRARFNPARDSAGKRVESAARKTLRWKLPKMPPVPLGDWTSTVRWSLGPNAEHLSCTIDKPMPVDAVDDCTLTAKSPVEFRQLMRRGAGTGVATVFIDRRLQRGQLTLPIRLGQGPGETLLAREVLDFVVDATGKVTSCKVLEFLGRSNRTGDPCQRFADSFLPAADSAGRPTSSQASYVFTMFRRE